MANTNQRQNYNKLSEQQKINLLTKNQQTASEQALAYANKLASGVQAVGQAAMRGGAIADIRPGMPGNQNATQAQYTKMLMAGVRANAKANSAGTNLLAKLRNRSQFKQALSDTSAGSGIYRGGASGTIIPPQPVRIL